MSIGVGATYTPLFRARSVEVRGTDHLNDAGVARLAGVSPEANLFSFDAAAATARLERDPWIARAWIAIDLPSTLRIEIQERRPVLAVHDGRSFDLVAGDGTELDRVDSDPGLPLLEVSSGTRARRTRQLTAGFAAAALAPMDPGLLASIDHLSMDPSGSLVLRMSSGADVIFGDLSLSKEKARSLAALLRWEERSGSTIADADLRAPGAPTARVTSARRSGE